MTDGSIAGAERVPSPNHSERRGGGYPALIVLHYTDMASTGEALARLCDPAAEVSAHVLIGPDGRLFQMVDVGRRAWHAGRAHWAGIDDVNSFSIGIELGNPGHRLGYAPFPEPQMAVLEDVLTRLQAQHAIPPERVLGHHCVSPGRKVDPGDKLDWARLARGGHAIWLEPPAAEGEGGDMAGAAAFRRAAGTLGYGVDAAEGWTDALSSVWQSFALRHLNAALGSRAPDAAGIAHAEALAERWPARPIAMTASSSAPS